jgi:hypothetical protein
MSDTQHDVRGDEESANSQTEESSSPQAAGMTVARMLANPRRIRRA